MAADASSMDSLKKWKRAFDEWDGSWRRYC
jgi:hypothetical protein